MSAGLNIYQRLHAVMGEIDYIQKEKKQGMRYSIVSHDKVTAAVRPLLHKHGVHYHVCFLRHGQDGNRTCAKIQVQFTNIDNPREFVIAESFGYGVDDQDKGPGKAMSYAVKYALLKTLGLETGDEPDEVQDERANWKPPEQTTSISPKDFKSVKGDPSSAQSRRTYPILLEAVKANKRGADLNDWWASPDNQDDIKSLDTDGRWKLFMEMIQHGIGLCKTSTAVNVFWSVHEKTLATLRKADRYKFEELEELMVTRATKLTAPDATLEFINAG